MQIYVAYDETTSTSFFFLYRDMAQVFFQAFFKALLMIIYQESQYFVERVTPKMLIEVFSQKYCETEFCHTV